MIVILLKQHRLINLTPVEGIEYEARSHTAQVMMEELAGTFGRNIMSDKAPQYGGRDWANRFLRLFTEIDSGVSARR